MKKQRKATGINFKKEKKSCRNTCNKHQRLLQYLQNNRRKAAGIRVETKQSLKPARMRAKSWTKAAGMCHKENKDAGNREKNRSNAASNVVDKACRNMYVQRQNKGCRNTWKKDAGIRARNSTRAAAEYGQKSEQGMLRIRVKNGTRASVEYKQKSEKGLRRNMCKKWNKGCCGIRAKNETRAGANTCKKRNKSCCGIRGTRAAVEYESKSEQGLQRNTTKNGTRAAAGVRAKNRTRAAPEPVQKNGTKAAPKHVQKTEQGLLRNTCKKWNKGCCEYV